MPRVNIVREINVKRSPRVMQAESIFELPPSKRSEEQWQIDFELPDEWNIGLIVGPSGSGKTTIAQELFGDHIVDTWEWSDNQSILDDFDESMSIKDVIKLLSSVGFSSPHSWLRPYKVLSTGEKFRVHMARTLSEMKDISVIDEFTSVVDRTVAKTGSAAIAKTVRKRDQKFIAISCHYDIIDWLEPDWVYKPQTNEFYTGRYLHQRPKVELIVKRVHYSAWELFRRFHYLDTNINKSAHCFVAFIDDNPAAFLSALSFPHKYRPGWRYHRLVCLPDFQGIGIGTKFLDYMGSVYKSTGKPIIMNLSHPAVIHASNKSPLWKVTRNAKRASIKARNTGRRVLNRTAADKRFTVSFEYVGPAMDKTEAQKILHG